MAEEEKVRIQISQHLYRQGPFEHVAEKRRTTRPVVFNCKTLVLYRYQGWIAPFQEVQGNWSRMGQIEAGQGLLGFRIQTKDPEHERLAMSFKGAVKRQPARQVMRI